LRLFDPMKSKDQEERLLKIAEKIKKLRIDAGYTSYENFAVKHGLDRKQYWRMEKGQNFMLSTLLRIIDIHKVSLAEFFEDL